MVQSSEYPDLKFVTPKSWTTANRTSVQLIVIHTTEGHENATSAEDGAAYDSRRTDGTSAHYFHDQNSTIQCVLTKHVAHTAFYEGNQRGIQHELCGSAGQTPGQWADAASLGTLRQAAKQCARDAKKWGIPIRKLTVAQVRSGQKGFCGHVDITNAFAGDHTDPGKNFPWTQFLGMVNEYVGGTTPPTTEGFLMALSAERQESLANEVHNMAVEWRHFALGWATVAAGNHPSGKAVTIQPLVLLQSLKDMVTALTATVAELPDVDGPALLSRMETISQAVGQVDENVLSALGSRADQDPAAVAELLKAALGDKADAVFRAGLGQ